VLSEDAVSVDPTANVLAVILLPVSVENPIEPAITPDTPMVDAERVDTATDDTTSVD
jgi:hypothetical protein